MRMFWMIFKATKQTIKIEVNYFKTVSDPYTIWKLYSK